MRTERVHADLERVEGKLQPLLQHAKEIQHDYLTTLVRKKISEAQQQLTEWPSTKGTHHENEV